MNLYLVTLKSGKKMYVIANSYADAELKIDVNLMLDFNRNKEEKKIKYIKLIGEKFIGEPEASFEIKQLGLNNLTL